MTLPHKVKVFSFKFALLDFVDPRASRYRYKMEGFDEAWIETDGANRFATFTNLRHGAYRFRLEGRRKDGVWSEERVVVVTIRTPPWRTWWAYAFYMLILVSAVWAYVRSHRRKLAYEHAVIERLRQVDKLKDEFLANTSHELRTPLHGMIGLAESLVDGATGPLGERTKSNLSMIISSGKRLTNLINDILDFSKLENRSLMLHKKPIELYGLTEVVLALTRPLAAHKDLALVNAVPADMPTVIADEDRLQQILHNLVGNAVKFTDAGTVTVSAEATDEELLVQVADTGIGIAEDRLERIFESFEQADGHTARIYGGTGLGLTVSKQLIELHGGDIRVASAPDAGSTFTFTLPLGRRESTEHAHAISKPRPAPLPPSISDSSRAGAVVSRIPEIVSPAENPSGEPAFRILIVDDEPVNRQVLINHLSLQRYRVTEAADGPGALRIIEREPAFDLVLLDVMMPRMTGYEVCRRLRERFPIHELPVILLTAKNRVSDRVIGFDSGANDYLVKPVAKDELVSRVKTHLEILDTNRNLECKVTERTRALKARIDELETLDQIVKTLNRETGLQRLLQVILEQGMALIPQAEKGIFQQWDPKIERFKITAYRNPGPAVSPDTLFTYEELVDRYMGCTEQIDHHIYIMRRFEGLPKQFAVPRVGLSMALTVEHRIRGFLIFTNYTDAHAFDQSDIRKLDRFRTHAVSALAKVNLIDELINTRDELIDTRKELVKAAHAAGVAENATNVLHHIGNTLNSVKTSMFAVQRQLQDNRWHTLLHKTIDLLETHRAEIDTLLGRDRGDVMRAVFHKLDKAMSKRADLLEEECRRVGDHLLNMRSILLEQQKAAQTRDILESVDLNQVLEEVLAAETPLLKGKGVSVSRDFQELPPVTLNLPKFSRVMSFLLQNAVEAMGEQKERDRTGRAEDHITVKTRSETDGIKMDVSDNGAGIDPEHLPRVFENGFTTRKNHLGFGLHYCANTLKEMSGSIRLTSDGPGLGARVSLFFPYRQTRVAVAANPGRHRAPE